MSTTPIDHVAFEHLGAVYFTEESVFGTTGAQLRRAAPVGDSVETTATQVLVDAMKLSPVPYDAVTPMAGDKGGSPPAMPVSCRTRRSLGASFSR